MFQVQDNGKPAVIKGSFLWHNANYDTFDQALVYAKDWMGEWESLPTNWDGQPHEYSGYGDMISIVEIKT